MEEGKGAEKKSPESSNILSVSSWETQTLQATVTYYTPIMYVSWYGPT